MDIKSIDHFLGLLFSQESQSISTDQNLLIPIPRNIFLALINSVINLYQRPRTTIEQ